MNKVIRIAAAVVIVALSAFFSYKTPNTATHAAPHEPSKHVAVAQDSATPHVHRADSAFPASNSPIDFKHIIGADYKRHTGEPTGGHTLLNGDCLLYTSPSPRDCS